MKFTLVTFVTIHIITTANCLPLESAEDYVEITTHSEKPDFCYAPPTAEGDPEQYPCTIFITAWWYDPEDHACERKSILVPTCRSTTKDRGMDLDTCLEICGNV